MSSSRARAVYAVLTFGTICALLFWLAETDGASPANIPTPPTEPSELASGDPASGGGGGGDRDGERRAAAAEPSAVAPVRLSPARVVEDPAATHGALEGTVVSTSAGRPVPGAELSFAYAGRTLSVDADRDGHFRFEAPEPGRYVLAIATAEGFQPFAPEWGTSPIHFEAAAGRRIEDVVVYLRPAVEYLGLVFDADGEPVEGAEVRLLGSVPEESALYPLADAWTTDEAGRFTFQAGDGAVLEASHSELGRGRAEVDFAVQASHQLTIRLGEALDETFTASGAIEGVVVDPGRQPVPGAVVRAEREEDNHALPSAALRPTAITTADGAGRFALEGLDAGAHTVIVRASGYARQTVRGVEVPEPSLRVELDEEHLLRGRVFDRESTADHAPEPVAGATVVVERATGPLTRTLVATVTTFGVDGAYEVPGLGEGEYRVTAIAHGRAPSAEATATLGDGEPPVVDLYLRAGGTLFGRVVSGDEAAPLEGARVEVEGRLGGGGGAVPLARSAATDADGAFEITGVPAGPLSLFVAAEDHHGRVLSGLSMAEGGELEVEVDLAPTEGDEAPHIELAGIGAVLAAEEDALVIGRVVQGGGAAEVGLVAGDAILAIDGTPVTDLGFGGSIERIRGPEGSAVVLDVRRAGTDQVVQMVVPRRRIRA